VHTSSTMLRSMKQKFGGGRSKSISNAAGNDKDAPSTSSISSQKSAPAISTKTSPARPPSATSQKPSQPALTEENLKLAYADPLSSFRDVPATEKQNLFVQKLHLCSFTFDFADQHKYAREKEIKRQTLLELIDYVNVGQGKFTEAVSEDIVFFLSSNLFRTLPSARSHEVNEFDPEEEEHALEPSWPHLQACIGASGYLRAVYLCGY
jgi:serine/threonine-protein phosphatase 2A regulatory subunit B'